MPPTPRFNRQALFLEGKGYCSQCQSTLPLALMRKLKPPALPNLCKSCAACNRSHYYHLGGGREKMQAYRQTEHARLLNRQAQARFQQKRKTTQCPA